MPILVLQQRMRELGRIRIGRRSATSGAPQKLDRFRVTSPSREVVEAVAAAYGGTAGPWSPPDGRQQWEVVTEATRLPILLPPQSVTQWLELWSGGGCVRRCDGEREVIADSPCLCDPDPARRECKPTTRLNVVLRDVPGLGVFRLESHGWNAATELPGVAAFAASSSGMLACWLTLEERVSKTGGQTRRFMVPGIDVDVTPSQLLAGRGDAAAVPAAARPALAGAVEPPAAAPPGAAGVPDYRAAAEAADDARGVREVWHRAAARGHLDEALRADLTVIARRKAPRYEAVDEDTLWSLIMAAAPAEWTTDRLEAEFAAANGGTMPGTADRAQLAAFLRVLQDTA